MTASDVARRLGQWWCGLTTGHWYLITGQKHVRLVCGYCGHTTPGWDVY